MPRRGSVPPLTLSVWVSPCIDKKFQKYILFHRKLRKALRDSHPIYRTRKILLNFHTNNLNKRLYRRMIENQLLHLEIPVYDFVSSWDIHFFSLDQTDPTFFDHIKTTSGQTINPSMPSGVTGQKEIKFWLHDSDNDFKTRENSDRVQHEVCHAVLFDKYGTQGGTWVNGVHQQTDRFIIKFWYWHKIFWRRFQLSIIDIKNLL